MTDQPNETFEDSQLRVGRSELGPARALLEVLAICVASFAGLTIGSLSGWLPLSPVLGMVFPIVLASFFLKREGKGWPALGFPKRMAWWKVGLWTVAALAFTILANALITPLLQAMNAPTTDIKLLTDSIEGNTLNYVVFMIFIVWGSAGFGEELVARGFILDRFTRVFGAPMAIVAQAVLFGLAHSYQGITGMVHVFVLAFVFGVVYVKCGRNLWPVIMAHGLMDTLGITAIYLGQGEAMVGN